MKMGKRKNAQKHDLKDRIIRNKVSEIESLKSAISELQISCDEKDALVDSIEYMLEDMLEVVNGLKVKREEYSALIDELHEMKNAMNQEVFKGRWNLVRWLIR